MAREKASWFDDLGNNLFEAMNRNMAGASSAPGAKSSGRVGQRKRAQRQPGTSGSAGGTVPTERALVPFSRVDDI